MILRRKLPRRTFLKGAGTAIALPWLDAMVPAMARAGSGDSPPCRMAFVYVPNGVHIQHWTPASEGTDFELPQSLEPLAPYRKNLQVLTGLTHDKARANGDGPGDHARAAAAFLTGVQPKKTHGADIHAGVSADQVAAAVIGSKTPLPSIELGCDRGMQSGNCDSGYSCAYSANISWRTPSTPMAKENNPRLVFERLFGSEDPAEAAESRAKRKLYNKSILDFVLEDTRQLKARLGETDRKKIDEYLHAVRQIEKRLASAEVAEVFEPSLDRPDGKPDDYREHIRLMFDLMTVAYQGDITRISTFMIANEGSNRSYRFIDVPEGHHDLSHHGGDEEKLAKIAKINRFHMEQFAYFIDRLETTPEGEGSLLDNLMIVYGSGISDGNRHNHNDLPVLLVGGGRGRLKPGRHTRYADGTPMVNLYLSMLDLLGVPTDLLGDSTGKLNYLSDIA